MDRFRRGLVNSRVVSNISARVSAINPGESARWEEAGGSRGPALAGQFVMERNGIRDGEAQTNGRTKERVNVDTH